jgi:hypothetical protein
MMDLPERTMCQMVEMDTGKDLVEERALDLMEKLEADCRKFGLDGIFDKLFSLMDDLGVHCRFTHDVGKFFLGVEYVPGLFPELDLVGENWLVGKDGYTIGCPEKINWLTKSVDGPRTKLRMCWADKTCDGDSIVLLKSSDPDRCGTLNATDEESRKTLRKTLLFWIEYMERLRKFRGC